MVVAEVTAELVEVVKVEEGIDEGDELVGGFDKVDEVIIVVEEVLIVVEEGLAEVVGGTVEVLFVVGR